jgi:hypothetical protein
MQQLQHIKNSETFNPYARNRPQVVETPVPLTNAASGVT